jgi:pilus assembly protein CpaB
MNRRMLGAVGAVVLATVGAITLVAFVRGAEGRAMAGEALVRVMVVKERIPAGTPASDLGSRVGIERVPAKVRADDALADVGPLGRRVAAIDLFPGEQLTEARFIDADAVRLTAVGVPEGMLEVTLSLEPERALGGVLRPGSSVGVLASFEPFEISSEAPVKLEGEVVPKDGKTPNSTHIILHKVLVTNVQSDSSFDPSAGDKKATAPAPGGNLLVTLAVDAPSIERLVFAAEHGSVWLALEPKGAPEAGTRVWTRGNIHQEPNL